MILPLLVSLAGCVGLDGLPFDAVEAISRRMDGSNDLVNWKRSFKYASGADVGSEYSAVSLGRSYDIYQSCHDMNSYERHLLTRGIISLRGAVKQECFMAIKRDCSRFFKLHWVSTKCRSPFEWSSWSANPRFSKTLKTIKFLVKLCHLQAVELDFNHVILDSDAEVAEIDETLNAPSLLSIRLAHAPRQVLASAETAVSSGRLKEFVSVDGELCYESLVKAIGASSLESLGFSSCHVPIPNSVLKLSLHQPIGFIEQVHAENIHTLYVKLPESMSLGQKYVDFFDRHGGASDKLRVLYVDDSLCRDLRMYVSAIRELKSLQEVRFASVELSIAAVKEIYPFLPNIKRVSLQLSTMKQFFDLIEFSNSQGWSVLQVSVDKPHLDHREASRIMVVGKLERVQELRYPGILTRSIIRRLSFLPRLRKLSVNLFRIHDYTFLMNYLPSFRLLKELTIVPLLSKEEEIEKLTEFLKFALTLSNLSKLGILQSSSQDDDKFIESIQKIEHNDKLIFYGFSTARLSTALNFISITSPLYLSI